LHVRGIGVLALASTASERVACGLQDPQETEVPMKRIGLGLVVAGFFGCASSTDLENKSRVHTMRADAAASVRDYNTAASEKQRAEELHAKAVKRAYKEGVTNEVTVPSDVPAPPNP
jgi:outer membrane murein-binding lipoprotein Lpp